jgi:hypothetical protein
VPLNEIKAHGPKVGNNPLPRLSIDAVCHLTYMRFP